MTHVNPVVDEPQAPVPPPRVSLAKLSRILSLRLLLGITTLLSVSIVIFAAVQFLPGDAAEILVGQYPDEQTIAVLRRELGLDQPPVLRYLYWVGAALQGDFGNSLTSGRAISDLIGTRLQNTLYLAFYAALIALPSAFVAAIFSVLKPGGLVDRITNTLSLVFLSSPQFLIAYVLVLFLAVSMPLFPSSADMRPNTEIFRFLYICFLPAVTLSAVSAGYMARMMRAVMLDVMERPFIRMAKLKGVTPNRVVLYHTLPNALGSIAAVAALVLAQLILGVVVVETVFVYPGLGQLLVDSVSKRDVTVVQAISLIFACVYILLNLTADLIAILTNPQILYPGND